MTKHFLAASVGACLLLAAPAVCVADEAMGPNEISGSLAYTDIEDVKLTIGQVSWGRYLTDMHEVGLSASYIKLEDFGDSLDGNTLGAFYHLNFGNSESMTPFIGVNASYVGGDLGDVIDFAYGATVGLKFYPRKNAGVSVGFGYQKFNASDGFEDVDGTNFNVGLFLRF